MEREHIIKALECCYINKPGCSDCPFQTADKYRECEGLVFSALSLIKELTEENERLSKHNAVLIEDNHILATEFKEITKADTVRKMKESIIEKACSMSMVDGEGKVIKIDYQISAERLDQIAKEMVEGVK